MFKRMHWAWACVLCLGAFATMITATPQPVKTPLEATRLLALVAGNALPENIVALVKVRGLAFKPTEEYRAQLTQAGATPEVLTAVNKAIVHAGTEAESTNQEAKSRLHLAKAGKLIRSKDYKEAEKELNAALESGGPKLDTGFVMGEAQRRQEEWMLAVTLYAEIIKEEEDFPEAQTKLSFVLIRAGDPDESLRTIQSVLAAAPNNAEAHKIAALAFEAIQKFDAAAEEYREALRIKPDYGVVHYDLGILLYNKRDFDGAISEYKKALALDPKDTDAHVNLALAYEQKNDAASAVRELREAKKLDPKDLSVRQNLGSVLVHQAMYEDAVTELREFEAIAPESTFCHVCLAAALYGTTDYEGARSEYQIAIRLDPADAMGYRGLGRTYEAQGKNDLALSEYRKAEELDPDSVEMRVSAGRVLLQMKQPKLAKEELTIAVQLDPGNSYVHDQYGRALEASGNLEQAKNEYQESLMLDGESPFALLDLAHLQEKQGDWADAMENYRTAARVVDAGRGATRGIRTVVDAPAVYQAAQLRLKGHLEELRTAGKTSEAAALEARISAMKAGQGISGKLDAAMEAGAEAMKSMQFDEAIRNYQEAVKLAEQMQPPDARLAMSLGYLGRLYYNQKDLVAARAALERQLKVSGEVYGAGSPQLSQALEGLIHLAMDQGDFPRAESLSQEELTVNEKSYGNKSVGYSMALMVAGYVYFSEKQYAKAEPYFEKALKIQETLGGPEEMMQVSSRGMLCKLYELEEQSAKSESCNGQLLVLMGKFYGENNPALAPVLVSQAKALRSLGRGTEADLLEKRMQAMQQAAAGTN